MILEVPDRQMLTHIRSRYLNEIKEILSTTPCRGQVSLRTFSEQKSGENRGKNSNNSAVPVLQPVKEETYFLPESLENKISSIVNIDFPQTVLYISGVTGSGKTSLLQHLNSEWTKNGISSRLISLEVFLTEFSLSLKSKDTLKWRDGLRASQTLIIDDFQFIKATAHKSQEELRNIIEDFQKKGHKLIIASDTEIDNIPLMPDLASRFLDSFMIRLNTPSLSMRRSIIGERANKIGVKMDESLIDYLARNIPGDARRLNSAVMRLSVNGAENPSREQIDLYCGELFTGIRTLSPEKVITMVAEKLHVTVDAITGPARDKQISLARHLVAYICTEHLKRPQAETASLIGRKDHASVIHARNKIEGLIKSDLFTSQLVDSILSSLLHE